MLLLEWCPVQILFEAIDKHPFEDASWRHELTVQHASEIVDLEIEWGEEGPGANLVSSCRVFSPDRSVGPGDTSGRFRVIKELNGLTVLKIAINLWLKASKASSNLKDLLISK